MADNGRGYSADQVVIDEAVDFDPRSLDGFTSVDDQLCPEFVVLGGPDMSLTLQCEVEGEHDLHEATYRWTSEPEEEAEPT